MADPIRVSGPISGTDKTLSFETGKLAPQSQGAVVAGIGNTSVLTTANAARDIRPGVDFFPLTVDVEERAYAAGKIPGSFFRREGRPTEDAILTCRLTDRPLRPSFPKGFRNETQVVTTVIGADQENPHDVLSINAASAALMISGIPFEGPIGSVRIAYSTDGEWIPHPTFAESDASVFELVVAGRELPAEDGGTSDVAVMMVEAGGTPKSFAYYAEGAQKVDEAVLASGLDACKTWIKESIALQRQLVASVIATHGPIEPLPYTAVVDYTPDVYEAVERVATTALTPAVTIALKADRNAAIDAAKDDALAALAGTAEAPGEFAGRESEIKQAVGKLVKHLVRKRIVDEGVRIDGRGVTDLRPVSAEVGVLGTAHGSGLFQRGETQVLNVCTLAMPRMNQLLDTLDPGDQQVLPVPLQHGRRGPMVRPAASVRRSVARSATVRSPPVRVLPVLPSRWTTSTTPCASLSEVLSLQRFSTSMASVCSGSSLALMDAGVPIKAPVAGIAMGLVFAGRQVHHPHRHPRRRGCLRRHGLQGRRPPPTRSPPSSWTPRSTASPPTSWHGRAGSGEGGPYWPSSTNMNACHLRGLAPKWPRRPRRSPRSSSRWTRSVRSSGRRARSSTRSSQETGADISRRRRRGAQGIVTIGAVEAWRMEEAKARHPGDRRSPPLAEVGVRSTRVVS